MTIIHNDRDKALISDELQIGDLVRYRNQSLPIGVITKIHTKVWPGLSVTCNVTWLASPGAYVWDTCEESCYLKKVTHECG